MAAEARMEDSLLLPFPPDADDDFLGVVDEN